jgi:hypothetical protein
LAKHRPQPFRIDDAQMLVMNLDQPFMLEA